MTTTSRRLSAKSKHNRNNHTPGKDKGGYCVRPTDFGNATKRNPYKGQGLKGNESSSYTRIWEHYRKAKNNA